MCTHPKKNPVDSECWMNAAMNLSGRHTNAEYKTFENGFELKYGSVFFFHSLSFSRSTAGERASERVREDKHTGMEIRRSDRKSWWEDERNVGFGLPVCLLRVQDCRILWNHTYILYFLNANKNRRSFDSVACLICVMLALVAVVILAAVRL